ncbi:cell wall hydrolase [Sphingomonas sp. RP10(2022)]|uniref:Cell wall hydrolase n=1 Tax=Sphingomonas liriopis TaxID=2949094 RepID=A0A9X2KRA5_9SPHN|nr:cell wall hydrolase [Sphingomonas liriopis]MCP3735820.1 cell wall hydrolase [Sphingomonas liriopis]
MQTIRTMTRVWAALVAIGLALTVALSAQAAWRAIAAHGSMSTPPLPAPAGYEAEEHFPGAALLYADFTPPATQDAAAPAQGVTGTTALPALPVSLAAASAALRADAGSVAAAPFSMKTASGLDRARALECLTAAIYYEAASEPDAGQSAVAQVILNRARHPAFPATVCGVVYQGSERSGCQFSFACDGAMARVPSRTAWARAARNASMALAGYVYAPVGLATHYHTYAVTPAWNRSLVMTDVVGAHLFHRWKGFWGTSAAFRQSYRGGEPLPGPHTPVLQPPVAASPALIAAAAPLPVAPVTRAADVRPAYAESGSYVTPPPAPARAHDNLPPASTVLDKWKDSGKPLL